MESHAKDNNPANPTRSSNLESSSRFDKLVENGDIIENASEYSPRTTGEDEEAKRLKELAADVQDQTDLERNIGRQVGTPQGLKRNRAY